MIVSASVNGKVKVWELGGREAGAGYGHSKEVVVVAASPDGKFLASGGEDNMIHLWICRLVNIFSP